MPLKIHLKGLINRSGHFPFNIPSLKPIKNIKNPFTILYTNMYAQTLILVKLIVVNLFSCFSTLLETLWSVFDHLWTQDSPICPLTVGGQTIPYIDQGWSKLKVLNFKP